MKIGVVDGAVDIVVVDGGDVCFYCKEGGSVVLGDRRYKVRESEKRRVVEFFRRWKLEGGGKIGLEFLRGEVVGAFDPRRFSCGYEEVVRELESFIGKVEWQGKVGSGVGGDKIGFFGEDLSEGVKGGFWLVCRADLVRFGPGLGVVSKGGGEVYVVLWKGTRVKQLERRDSFLRVLRKRLASCREKYLEMGRLLERSRSVLVRDPVLFLKRVLDELKGMVSGELERESLRGCVSLPKDVSVFDIVEMVGMSDCEGSSELAGEVLRRLDFCPYCCRAF